MRRFWETDATWQTRLAARAQQGDRAAFVELYRALYPVVARFVARRVRAKADAEDLVARTFHVLLEKLDRIDTARGTPLGYALEVARHAVVDHLRARQREEPGPTMPEQADGATDALSALEHDESLRAVAARVAILPTETRRVLELRFGDGLRHAEIAALTGASEAAVRQRLSRGLRDLRVDLSRPSPGAEEVAS